MKIKKIVFTLENCDTITIPGQYIGDICLKDFKTELSRQALNSIDKMDICEHFFIEIHKFANTSDYAFSEDSNSFKDDPYNKFDRLHKYHDITYITITLFDYKNKEYSYEYFVPYLEEREGVLGSPNIYQSSYISDLGHLYLLIDPELKIDDVLDYNSINDKVAMHFNFELLGIEEDDEEDLYLDSDENKDNNQ